MRGIVNTVVGIFGPILFRLQCGIFVEVMVYLTYEDLMFWPMDAIALQYRKLQRIVIFQE
jgi:hypothetical protein